MHSSARTAMTSVGLYEERVNPQWVRLLDVLEMNVRSGKTHDHKSKRTTRACCEHDRYSQPGC
jgi:hypothetical protein